MIPQPSPQTERPPRGNAMGEGSNHKRIPMTMETLQQLDPAVKPPPQKNPPVTWTTGKQAVRLLGPYPDEPECRTFNGNPYGQIVALLDEIEAIDDGLDVCFALDDGRHLVRHLPILADDPVRAEAAAYELFALSWAAGVPGAETLEGLENHTLGLEIRWTEIEGYYRLPKAVPA